MIVDARGKACPEPVVMAIKALGTKKEDESLEVLVDNEAAVHNVTRMAEQKGFEVTVTENGEQDYSVFIGGVPDAPVKALSGEKNLVVAVSANVMGGGNDVLGAVLIKGFLYTLTQVEVLPKTIIFYNSGAKLSCAGSDSLEDLRWLESQGVEILTCGTCLNFYELTDKLGVGTVSNMYTIVETLMKADQVIRP